MSTKQWLSVTILTSTLLIFGCSKPSDVEVKDTKRSRTTIKLMGVAPLTDKDFFKDLLEHFREKHPEINLRYDYVARDYSRKVLTQIAGGTAPDVFFIGDAHIPVFAEKGALLSLDSFIKESKVNLNDYFPQAWESYSYKDKIYGISESFSPFIMYYNKEIFDEAGIGYPDETWDWEKFLEVSKKLTKRDERGITTQFGVSGVRWLMLMMQAEGKIFNADKTKCIINSPENIEALRFYYDLRIKYHVMPTARDTDTVGETYTAFMMGKSAMFYGGRWNSRYFRTKKDLKFGLAVLPKGKRSATLLASHAFAITSACKHPEKAWKLVRFLMGEEAQKISHFGKIPDSVPTLKKLASSEKFLYDPRFPEEKDNKIYVDSLGYAFSREVSPYITCLRVNDITEYEIDLALMGKQTVEDALKKAEDRINAVIMEGE